MWNRIPIVTKFCIYVPDLKIAVIIIAVYGIVTCPPISWALMRHTYAIRMCSVATANSTHEGIDIDFRNIFSIGLGVNAGHETCFKPAHEKNILRFKIKIHIGDDYIKLIKYLIWAVFVADVVFLISSGFFLYKIFSVMTRRAFDFFFKSVIVNVAASFIYAILFVFAYTYSGIGFPILELLFAIFDLVVWIYFIIVIKSYGKTALPTPEQES